jgi:hypothetical protein
MRWSDHTELLQQFVHVAGNIRLRDLVLGRTLEKFNAPCRLPPLTRLSCIARS